MRSRWGVAVLAVAVTLLGLVMVPAARAGVPPQPAFHDATGIHVVSVQRLDARQFHVRVLSAALARPVDVRILLPAAYRAQPRSRYPVLYLFHGTSGRAADWVNMGGAEQSTAALPLIVVMPDAGFNGDGGGWFTNWVDTTTVLGPSQWETFHIGQLIPWVDANLRTIANRNGRAVAGLSQGGFGSTTYPARHPDLFISAASFSGAPDIDYNPAVAVGASVVIAGTALGLDGVQPDAMFGSRLTDEINWQGHDPADLVSNLRGVDVWLYTASGLPGPYDPTPANVGAMGIEAITHGSTESFYLRAQQVGVPVHLVDYVYGTHSWGYWARDLREYLAPLMQIFAHPPAAPAAAAYESIDRSWAQWGWSVSWQRPVGQEFSALINGRPGGFALQGRGSATVVTPPFYRPGSMEIVTVSGSGTQQTSGATADRNGRLHIAVPLGSSVIPPVTVIGLPGIASFGNTATVTISASHPPANH